MLSIPVEPKLSTKRMELQCEQTDDPKSCTTRNSIKWCAIDFCAAICIHFFFVKIYKNTFMKTSYQCISRYPIVFNFLYITDRTENTNLVLNQSVLRCLRKRNRYNTKLLNKSEFFSI